MLAADLLQIVKRAVDVVRGAGDELGVAVDGLAEPLDGLAGLRGVLGRALEGGVGGRLGGVDAVDDAAGAGKVVEEEAGEEGDGAACEAACEGAVATALLSASCRLEAD